MGGRFRTATERDLEGIEARRERECVPVSCDEDVTGRYTGEELAEMRGRRTTEQRIARIEEKHDRLSDAVSELAVTSGKMEGKLSTLVELASKADAAREAQAKREAEERGAADERASRERQMKRRLVVPIIKALGAALAVVITALVARGV